MCKPTYRIVQAGFLPPDPNMIIAGMRMSYRDERGIFVRADDAAYLRNKWRPEGAFNLVEMDIATDAPSASIVGESDRDYFGDWDSCVGMGVGMLGMARGHMLGMRVGTPTESRAWGGDGQHALRPPRAATCGMRTTRISAYLTSRWLVQERGRVGRPADGHIHLQVQVDLLGRCDDLPPTGRVLG